jgi:NTP pyrophosphatase (non-canonical NTP hydrolase)
MDKLYLLAMGLNKRFPDGNTPYQIATRLAEECGEVASEVCHFEGSGIKKQKRGEPNKQDMAGEIKNVLSAVMQLAIYYDVTEELEKSIDASLERLKTEGLID